MEKRWIKHYNSNQMILLVGEGDFSFAACLANAFGHANNIVATSLDSEVTVTSTYHGAITNLKQLQEMGCTVLHGLDARTMSTDIRICFKSFDRIVFNFPHAGFSYREIDLIQIMLHQGVVKDFLRSARDMLGINGEVHVTHKTAYPFDKWEIEKLAQDVGLCLVDKAPFSLYDYPNYINKRGSGSRSDQTFRVGECSTFKFVKK